MKKIIKIFTLFTLVLGIGVALVACGPTEDPSEPTPAETIVPSETGSETEVATDHKVEFVTEVPEGTLRVFVIGSINDWELETAVPMTKGQDGKWRATVKLAEGTYEYKYINDRDWGYVEKTAEDEEMGNRGVTVGATGAVVSDVVAKWAQLWAPATTTLRGVTDTTILVGNTAILGGPLAFVGVPFIAGMEVAFRKANAAEGKLFGREIELIVRDDGGDVATGVANTKTLVEDDKVFAIVGHFAATVGATVEYLKQQNVPMFYAANGTNLMYAEGELGNPIFPVQPISKPDGRMMLARALTNPIHGANGDEQLSVATAKIGVLKATSSGSAEMHEGIVMEAGVAGLPTANLIVQEFDSSSEASMTSAANAIHAAGVDAILLPLSQLEYKAILPAIVASGNTAPTYGSYFVADKTSIPESYTGQFRLYANAWLDITSESGAAAAGVFVADIMADTELTAEEKSAYMINSFAIAGYIAGTMFVESILRMGNTPTDEFSVEKYIASNEASEFVIPMGGTISFVGGDRLGISELSLLEFVIDGENRDFLKAADIEHLSEVQERYK